MFNVIITGITSFLTDLSTEMVYPLIPLFLTTLTGSPWSALGLIEGFSESTASLLKVFSGQVSDRAGRRKPLAILGYAGSTLGKVLFYLAQGWGMVFAGRLADRVGKGIRTAPRDAIIADSTRAGQRGAAFGLHRAMDTIGAAAGVAVAILLVSRFPLVPQRADFLPVFLLALVPQALGVAVLFLVRETRSGPTGTRSVRLSFRDLPVRLRWFFLVVGLFALGNSSNQFLILRTKTVGYTIVNTLAVYLLYNIVYGLLSWPAGRIADAIGRKRLLVAGYAVYGLVYVGFAVLGPGNYAWLPWLLFGLYGVYSALTEGLEKAFVADIAPQAQRATFIGLHSTLVGIGLLPASLAAGLLWGLWGPRAPFWFGGVLGLAAALGLALVL
ncbi:MAG: MFS transporter [candidate division WOR-3 bacterium]